jgi:hypothetical protein
LLRCDRQANREQNRGDGNRTPDHAAIHNEISANASEIFA